MLSCKILRYKTIVIIFKSIKKIVKVWEDIELDNYLPKFEFTTFKLLIIYFKE